MKYLVVGSPISHSLSPVFMNPAFRAAGIDAVYETREIHPRDWPDAMPALHAEGIAGVNVTVPLKEAAVEGARWVNPIARSVGAANTLLRGPGGWRADNTDAPGFHRWLVSLDGSRFTREEALVLGAGGSARAVVWALRESGCRRIRIAARTPERAQAIARRWETRIDVEEPGGPAPRGGLVVNCTPLGLRGDDPLPIPADALEGAGLVLDLVYPDTPLVRAAAERGIPAHDGLGLLVHQGALSFELWTGEVPDREAMLEAVRREIAERPAPGGHHLR